jgi:hypothetical protein
MVGSRFLQFTDHPTGEICFLPLEEFSSDDESPLVSHLSPSESCFSGYDTLPDPQDWGHDTRQSFTFYMFSSANKPSPPQRVAGIDQQLAAPPVWNYAV